MAMTDVSRDGNVMAVLILNICLAFAAEKIHIPNLKLVYLTFYSTDAHINWINVVIVN